MDTSLADDLTRFCKEHIQTDGAVANLRRLTGGANSETWSFDYDGAPLILRRSLAPDTELGLSSETEAALIQSAHAAGVTTPSIIAVLSPDDNLGTGFVMTRVMGEALPQKLFKDPQYEPALERFVDDCARELARIHKIPPQAGLSAQTIKEKLAHQKALYLKSGADNPVLSYAMRWLEENCPNDERVCVVHGDFRMGNLLLEPEGLSAVLDWELAHISDPVSDLAYLCAPCWRFGRYDKPVGGVGDIKALLTAYERETGQAVDMDRFHFWMVYASFSWAMICLHMINSWRSHEARSLERPVIGTRVSENEVDIMILLTSDRHASVGMSVDDFIPDLPSPTADSTGYELACAVREWVETDIQPGAKGRDLFQARVARNALGIIERKLRLGPLFSERQEQRLSALNLTPVALNQGLLSGSIGFETLGVLDHLKLLALEHVSLDQPKHAGLALAKKQWLSA